MTAHSLPVRGFLAATLALAATSLWCALPATAQTTIAGDARAGKIIRDCADCPEVVVIPAGRFTMGATAAEQADMDTRPEPLNPKSTPRHTVTIARAFGIGRTEVTREQYAVFAKDMKWGAPSRCLITDFGAGGSFGSEYMERRDWRYPTIPATDKDPVLCTNWYDAIGYVEWLSRKTGKRYRLPSEAEWEYAARAGSTTHYSWGDDPKLACEYGNMGDESFVRERGEPSIRHFPCDDRYPYKSPAGSFKPNAWGVHDMHGNVWEILQDCWHASYEGAPTDGSAWIAGGDCQRRVLRGDGEMGFSPIGYLVHRYAAYADEHRSNTGGFRVARELDPAEAR